MEKVRFRRVVQVSENKWDYLPFEVFREEVLSVIPYPLPVGETDLNRVLAKPQWKNWPVGGCVILLKNSTWVHVDESLESVESVLLD
jgi:hypothetical protein